MTRITVENVITITDAPRHALNTLASLLNFWRPVEEREYDGSIRRHNELYHVVERRGDEHAIVPYGALNLVWSMFPDARYDYNTAWFGPTDINRDLLNLPGDDRQSQEAILTELTSAFRRKQYGSCIIAPCGAGKTRIGIRILWKLLQPSLVVVHTKELMDQWVARIIDATQGSIPVGTIANGRITPGFFTVGLVQTLTKCADEVRDQFGCVIMDEAHHTSAETFCGVMSSLNATVKIGFTASEERRDKMHPLVYSTIGPILYRVKQSEMVDEGTVMSPAIHWVRTGWGWGGDPKRYYTKMISDIVDDPYRNELLARKIVECIDSHRHLLVLSSRVDHLHALRALVDARREGQSQLLTGREGKRDRQTAMRRMCEGFPVTFATIQLAKEGLDAPILDALLLATPVRDDITVQQTVGRIQRTSPDKPTPLVIDFEDRVGVLMHQAEARSRMYRTLHATTATTTPSVGLSSHDGSPMEGFAVGEASGRSRRQCQSHSTAITMATNSQDGDSRATVS